jgi:hypothetical protein
MSIRALRYASFLGAPQFMTTEVAITSLIEIAKTAEVAIVSLIEIGKKLHNMSPVVAIFISLLALGFTIFSFWYQNTRQGKIQLIGPQFISGRYSNRKLEIKIPVVFRNTGPRPIVLSGLRLQCPTSDHEYLLWLGFSNNPLNNDFEFKRPVVVKGFEAVERILFFQRENVASSSGSCEVELIGIDSTKSNWGSLKKFKLHTPKIGWSDQFSIIDIMGGLQTGEKIQGDAQHCGPRDAER